MFTHHSHDFQQLEKLRQASVPVNQHVFKAFNAKSKSPKCRRANDKPEAKYTRSLSSKVQQKGPGPIRIMADMSCRVLHDKQLQGHIGPPGQCHTSPVGELNLNESLNGITQLTLNESLTIQTLCPVAEKRKLLVREGDGNFHTVEPLGGLQNSHQLQEPQLHLSR